MILLHEHTIPVKIENHDNSLTEWKMVLVHGDVIYRSEATRGRRALFSVNFYASGGFGSRNYYMSRVLAFEKVYY